MNFGRIILLNGASSAGKTSICKALQQISNTSFTYVSLDKFIHRRPEVQRLGENHEGLKGAIDDIVSDMYRFIREEVSAGKDIVVDHVLEKEQWLEECIQAFKGIEVLFVGVRCTLKLLERREKKRGDRYPGLARFHFGRVHKYCIYDLEVDTSKLSPTECAVLIYNAFVEISSPKAFDAVKQSL